MKKREELVSDRRAIGWTQKDLAEKARIGLVTVINWEKGKKVRPGTEKAIRVALKAGMDDATLLML